jgi:hypothetical protein
MNAEEPEKLTYENMGTGAVPPPETLIWRYMDLPKFVCMLKRGALYLPVVAALDDEFEAAPLSPRNPTKQKESMLWHQWSVARATAFVSCWHESRVESAAMWKLYGNSIAIHTTFGALSSAISQPWESEKGPLGLESTVIGGRVRYVNPDAESPAKDVWTTPELVLRKRSWYRHEREVRLVCDRPNNFECGKGASPLGPPGAAGTPKSMGLWALCNLKAMIQGIVIAPKSPRFIEDAAAAVCESFGLDPSLVTRSKLEKGAPQPPRTKS